MSLLIRIAFLGTFFFALSEKVLAVPVLEPEELEALLEDYGEGEEDQAYVPPYLWKRGSFWSSHPSDYNPMRRPTSGGSQTGGRGSKKSESNPYHPIPRSVNISQKNQRSQEGASTNEDLENLLEGLREKRQSIGSFLLMKLGRKNQQNSKSGADVTRRLGRRRV